MNFIKIPGKEFEMADAPVTQSEWKSLMGSNPSHFKGSDNPVERVSWNDCRRFITKLNKKKDGYTYRLPTEEEWEFCAKSCDDQQIMDIAWCWENSDRHWERSAKTTHPIKQKEPNALGLYDLLGNVWEWTVSKAGPRRVLHGGSWIDYAQSLSSASRYSDGPSNRHDRVGLRLVRTNNRRT